MAMKWPGIEAAQLYLDLLSEIGRAPRLEVVEQDHGHRTFGRMACLNDLDAKKFLLKANDPGPTNVGFLIHMGGHLLAWPHREHDAVLDRFVINASHLYFQLSRGLLEGVLDLRNLARHMAYLEDHCGIRFDSSPGMGVSEGKHGQAAHDD